MAHANAVHLSRIVDDILDVDRVKHGRRPLAPRGCLLHTLARQAVEAVQAFGNSFGVAIPCGPWPEDAEAFADPDRVVQILVNLLSNAVNYSPPGGPVHTRIGRAEPGWVIEVEDPGPGIPKNVPCPHLRAVRPGGRSRRGKPRSTSRRASRGWRAWAEPRLRCWGF